MTVIPRRDHVVVVSSVLSAIACVLVFIRLASKVFIIRRVGLDDILAFVAVCFSFGMTAALVVERNNGLGNHIWTLEPANVEMMFKAFFVSIFMYNAGLICAKNSILFQFLRFFQGRKPRTFVWCMIVFVTGYGIIAMVCMALACHPVAYFWDRTIPGGRCFNLMAFWFANAASCIITDILLCIMPIPVLATLHLPRRQKYSLMLVFFLGGFASVVAILRVHSIYIVGKSNDVTYDNVAAATWSSVELNTGIICACLPSLRHLIERISPTLLGSRRTSRPTENVAVSPPMSKQLGLSSNADPDDLEFCSVAAVAKARQESEARDKEAGVHTS